MTGGPSTPALAAAVANCGGLGFLAAGMLSAEELADAIAVAKAKNDRLRLMKERNENYLAERIDNDCEW